MKYIITLFFAGIIGFTITSCDPGAKFKTEIAEIDSCLLVLDTIETKFDGIEFDSLQLIVEHVLSNERTIKNNYVSDTINEELGRNMNQCKGIRKFFESPSADRNKYKQEIIEIRSQFENLKEDINNGILEKEKIDLYINNEKSDLNLFNLMFTEYHEKQIKAFNIYYIIVPQVDAFIEEMMSNNDEVEI